MRSILLDTNAYSHLLMGSEEVLDAIAGADTVYMSIFVLGELYTGFIDGMRERENRDTLQRFLSKPTVKILNATSETAECFASVKSILKKAGTPIPVNDAWIAAHALETGSTIITFDAHFIKIAGLRVWDNI